MQNESTIEVKAEDKLRWLRRLDGGRGWESLDDYRCCRCCGKTFSGRQVQLIGGTRVVRASTICLPNTELPSTPADWRYRRESGAAAKQSASRSRPPHVVRVKHARHVLRRNKQPANWIWKLRHILQRHLDFPV